MPADWTLLLYTQSLILTGPIGLVQAIVIDIVVEEVAERIDNKIIKLLVLFGGGRRSLGVSGVRGTILGAKEVLKGLGKTIRAVKAIRKRPKTTIPQAKVVKGGKGVKKPAKASDPKKIKEDRKIAARRRAMIILEERLKAVKQVDLGGPKTIEKVKINNTVTEVERELNGLETASLLFGGNLATFSKIAQHWPQELAKKYLNGLKNLREHLRKLKKTEEEIKEETKKFVENRWDTIRENFYKNIWKDKELVKELKKIGIIVRSGGRAPLLKIPGGKFVINLDHIRRKIEYPRDAFKLKNLRFATPLENSGLKEALEKSTKWPSTPVGSVNGPVSKLTKAEFDAMIDRLFEYEVQVKREWYVL
jgi:hypothetical protein